MIYFRLKVSVLLIVLVTSSTLGSEVALIIRGRIVTDSVSYVPVANIPVQAYKIESYTGHNSMDTSSLTGTAVSDSQGWFMICMVMHGGQFPADSDSLCITYPGFTSTFLFRQARNNLLILNNSKKVKPLSDPLMPFVRKGDTIIIKPGDECRYFLDDPVFETGYCLAKPCSDSIVLPDWVVMDECTSSCFRITASLQPGIFDCRLTRQLNEQMVYHCTFTILVQQPSLVMARAFRSCNQPVVSVDSRSSVVFVAVQNALPERITIRLFSVDGTLLRTLPAEYSNKKQFTIAFSRPVTEGVFLLEVHGEQRRFSQLIRMLK